MITQLDYECTGDIDNLEFLGENFSKTNETFFNLYGHGYRLDELKTNWENKVINGLTVLFIKRLTTEMRLTDSNPLIRSRQYSTSPIYKIYKNFSLGQKISSYFRKAFGKDLVLNKEEINSIPFHVGNAPDPAAYTMEKQDEYYALIKSMPQLAVQGDGMRSFTSILIDAFTSNYSITLIDEPEAFLHPPQARLIGKILASEVKGRQLFLATHSEDFLLGLLDADNTNIIVIRIDRKENINKMNVISSAEVKKLWKNPILRYSNILSGVFHDKVVICESDYDCLFYQAMIDAIYESKGEVSPDILYVQCGGKNRIKDVAAALKSLDVNTVAISDFDLINSKIEFTQVAGSLGIDISSLKDDIDIIYNIINSKNKNKDLYLDQLKKVGKTGFDGEAPAAYEHIEKICKANGLYMVPVGEMESFDKTINKQKKDWVYKVLEEYNLATEPKLEAARRFVMEVVGH